MLERELMRTENHAQKLVIFSEKDESFIAKKGQYFSWREIELKYEESNFDWNLISDSIVSKVLANSTMKENHEIQL